MSLQWLADIGVVKFIPYDQKIADIQENDTTDHYIDLTAVFPGVEIVAIHICAIRSSGTGYLKVWPAELSNNSIFLLKETANTNAAWVILADGLNRIMWRNSVANDDWDIYCFGYLKKVNP